MTNPRNKREAARAVADYRAQALQSDAWANEMDAAGAHRIAKCHRRDARAYRAEAARITKLMPLLPA